MSLRPRDPHGQEPLLVVLDDVSVLRVHLADGADLLAGLEALQHLVVPKHEHVLVGHEHLEGVDAALLGRNLPHVPADVLVPVGDGHVQGVITAHLLVRPGTPFRVGVNQWLAWNDKKN